MMRAAAAVAVVLLGIGTAADGGEVDQLLGAATELAREIAQCAPLSLTLTRRALYQGLTATFEAQVRHEGYALEYLYRTRDHGEAVAAFREKRPPRFEGR